MVTGRETFSLVMQILTRSPCETPLTVLLSAVRVKSTGRERGRGRNGGERGLDREWMRICKGGVTREGRREQYGSLKCHHNGSYCVGLPYVNKKLKN